MNDMPLITITVYNTRSKNKAAEKTFHMDGYVYDESINSSYTGETVPIEYAYYSAVESGYKEPKIFKAMMKLNEEERNKWLEGVTRELNNL